jgi:hypothetical protein
MIEWTDPANRSRRAEAGLGRRQRTADSNGGAALLAVSLG